MPLLPDIFTGVLRELIAGVFFLEAWMRNRAVLLLVMLLLIFPATVKAGPVNPVSSQQDLKLTLLYVSVWPEYELSAEKPDTINVLVIDRFLIDTQSTKFPTKLTLQIPATAIQPHVVAVGQTPETVSDSNVEFSLSAPANGWINVLVTATGPAIQLEYYDYNLIRNGDARQYLYEWPGSYALGTLHLDFRVPMHATNMRSDPVISTSGTDADGFKFGEITVPDLPAGQNFTLNLSYHRDTDEPSTSFMHIKPSVPLDQPVNGQFSLAAYVPSLAAGFVLVLLAVGVGWYWLSTHAVENARQPRKRRAGASTAAPDSTGDVYCHECGKRAQHGDQFCRTCGTQLRHGE
jgi:hypothetical protein